MWHQIDIVKDENFYTVANHKIIHNLGPICKGPSNTNTGKGLFPQIKVTSKNFELMTFSYMYLQKLSIILCTRYNTRVYP